MSGGFAPIAVRLAFGDVIFAADIGDIDARRRQLEPHVFHRIRDNLRDRRIAEPLVARRYHVPWRSGTYWVMNAPATIIACYGLLSNRFEPDRRGDVVRVVLRGPDRHAVLRLQQFSSDGAIG